MFGLVMNLELFVSQWHICNFAVCKLPCLSVCPRGKGGDDIRHDCAISVARWSAWLDVCPVCGMLAGVSSLCVSTSSFFSKTYIFQCLVVVYMSSNKA